MATAAQIQAALSKAQAAGNAQDVAALQSALAQAQQATPTSEQLSQAFHAAVAAGNQDDARQIIGYVQQHGMTIAPPSQAQTDAGMQRVNAQNIASQSPITTALQGAGKSFVDTGRGIGELVGLESAQDVAESRRMDQALMGTTAGQLGYGGGMAAQVVGGAALGGIAAGAPVMAALAPAAPTVAGALAGGALTGMAYGDVAPYASTGEHVGNIVAGGLLGPALAGAAKGVQLAGRGGKALLQRYLAPDAVAATRVGSALANDGASSTAIRSYVPNVAGERPTLAQVVQTPKAVQLERAARSNPITGPDLVAQDNANNATRMGTIERHAGHDIVGSMLDQSPMDALTAATETRRANATPFVRSSIDYLTPAERWGNAADALGNASGRMSGSDKDAITQAQKIAQKVRSGQMQEDEAAEELGHLGASVTSKAAQDAFAQAGQATTARMVNAQPVLDAIARRLNNSAGQDAAVTGALAGIRKRILDATDTRGNVPVDVLDGIRQNGGSFIADHAPNQFGGASTRQIAGIAPVQSAIADLLSSKVPGYSDYLARYAQQSAPVTTMTSVRELLDPNTVKALNASGDRQATATQLSRFLDKNAGRTYGVSPEAQRDIEAAHRSLLDRSVVDQKIGAAGSNTDADIQNRLIGAVARHGGSATGGGIIGAMAAGPFGAGLGTLGGLGIDFADQVAARRISAALGQHIMNPSMAANALDRYLLLQGRRQAFNNALVPVGQYGGIAGLLASPSRTSGGQ